MTPERERELMRHVPTLGCVEEAEGFLTNIKAQGEQVTTDLLAAVLSRIAVLRNREARE